MTRHACPTGRVPVPSKKPFPLNNYRTALALLAALILLAGLGGWVGNQRASSRAAEMRASLLRQATELARAINPELARKLTFTAADKGAPAYDALREQMMTAGRSVPDARWLYLMANRNNHIVFGPDVGFGDAEKNEPPAQPGEPYDDASVEITRSFETRQPFTEGPLTDKWGTFVSAFAPIFDVRSGEVLILIGLDVEVGDWQAQVNIVRREPLLLVLGVFLLLLAGTAAVRRRNRQRAAGDLKLRAWIIAPVALALLVVLATVVSYELRRDRDESQRDMRLVLDQATTQWDRLVLNSVQMLRAQVDLVARNPELLEAWQDRNRETLTARSLPVFEALKAQFNITHFYFTAPDRTCFLRVHEPKRRGDLIDRTTLLMAARTGMDAWGSELGPLGSFTLRYVRPWIQDGKIIGYLELGVEIEHLTTALARDLGVEIVSVIRKEYTNQEKFEAGKKAFGFAGAWNELPDIVVASQSLPVLPDELARRLKAGHAAFESGDLFRVRQGAKLFDCGVIHLPEAAGREVSALIVLHDVTAVAAATRAALFLNAGIIAMVLAGMLALLWSITRRAERQLADTFGSLIEGERRLQQAELVAGFGSWEIDLRTKQIISSKGARAIYGLSDTALNLNMVQQLALPEYRKELDDALRALVAEGKPYDVEFEIRRKGDGSVVAIHSVAHYDKNANAVAGTIHDITKRRQTEKEQRDAAKRHGAMIAGISDVIGIMGADGVMKYKSPNITKYFGWQPEDLVGTSR